MSCKLSLFGWPNWAFEASCGSGCSIQCLVFFDRMCSLVSWCIAGQLVFGDMTNLVAPFTPLGWQMQSPSVARAAAGCSLLLPSVTAVTKQAAQQDGTFHLQPV